MGPYVNPAVPDKILAEINSGYAFREIYKSLYPARFECRIPLKVVCHETVYSDLSLMFPEYENHLCKKGVEYYVKVNSYGTVFAIMEDSTCFDLKSSEFEVTEYHEALPKNILEPLY